MKKIFTLFAALTLAAVAYAQSFVSETNSQQAWWGYVTSMDGTGVGTRTAETYDCAIFIPGNHAIAGGKSILAIRFGLLAPSALNVKAWVASSLPSDAVSADNTLQIVDVPASQLGSNSIDVALPSACAIPAEGIYVGYTFTLKNTTTSADQYPVLFTGDEAPNTLILRTSKNVTSWTDMYGNGFGSLCLQVLLEGIFADNSATAADFGPVYTVIGGSGTAKITVMNGGVTPVASIDYTITTDGVAGAEQHADFAEPIAFNTTGNTDISIPADATAGIREKTLNITKVNGNENANANLAANFTHYTLQKLIDRNVVVEQFTGTGCGWCPRGHVGMAKMREAFGDRFVGIALHQYSAQNQDAMYIANSAYAPLSFTGAPSCFMNRGELMDPYYGTADDILDDFRAEMAIPALAEVNVSGTLNEETTQVEAKAKIIPCFDGIYKLEFVLVADGLKGTGAGWTQSNYYSKAYASQTGITKNSLPEDLQYLYDLGSTFTPVFNDVAIASSYLLGVNQIAGQLMTADTEHEISYTLNMPTYAKLKNAIDNEQVYVVAILSDNKGNVVNVGKQKVTMSTPTGIDTVEMAGADGEQLYYTVDGRKTTDLHKGLNIVRKADGKTVKVVVK